MNHQANEVEAKLKDSSYHGEKGRWNFEKYVCMHQDQHMILQGLVEHEYAGIDECSIVRHLLVGIKTNELDTAKGQVWASPSLQNNFDDCLTLYQDFINNKKTAMTRTSTITSIGTKLKHDVHVEDGDVEPDMSVDDRYYTGKEYAKLSKAKKSGLKLKRQKRSHKPANKNKPKAMLKPTTEDQVTTCIIKALSKIIVDKGQSDDEDANARDTSDANTPNQGNKALQ